MLEEYFAKYRTGIIGIDKVFESPFGEKELSYADWTASGRMYGPIEEKLLSQVYPLVANTHTDTTITGKSTSYFYKKALQKIKSHVNANDNDALISSGTGMTGAVNKFQRILGLKTHESHKQKIVETLEDRPVVFTSHLEHHSNHTSWLETVAEVVIIPPNDKGKPCIVECEHLFEKYADRKTKYVAITSCSNVTGIMTDYHDFAKLAHKHGAYIFVDFACSAPYIDIDMHPEDDDARLDAIFFSPHKFLGGPGSAGVLIFNKELYQNKVPDNPGGGTVTWTNAWEEHKYIDDIETREDGGTPGFIQTIRTALAIQLKEEMGVDKIMQREHEIIDLVWEKIQKIKGVHLLANNIKDRLCVFSFVVKDVHYNLVVKILNDLFGIQTRGGCSCAGTYGHYLLDIAENESRALSCEFASGDLSHKPGWIRMSLHPTSSNTEIIKILEALDHVIQNHAQYSENYVYNKANNEWYHKSELGKSQPIEINLF